MFLEHCHRGFILISHLHVVSFIPLSDPQEIAISFCFWVYEYLGYTSERCGLFMFRVTYIFAPVNLIDAT